MHRALAFMLLMTLFILPVYAQDYTPEFEADDCMFIIPDGVEIECGWLIVPEDRNDPDGATIYVAVAIIYSQSDDPEPDPVIYLEGGPGGSALAAVDAWAESALLTNRDLILVDQRGTGYSEPSLNCPEVDEDSDSPTEDCYNRLLDEGVNLSAYNSRENAADIADLIAVLDYDEANLYGISYGTRLALTIMRDRPERIRSVIIDGVYPPHVQGYEEQALWADRAYQILFDDCEADATCNAAFPNLRQVFYDTVDDLNANPAVFFEEEMGVKTEFTGDDFVNEIFQLMYSADEIPFLPLMIYQASEGIFGEAGAFEDNGDFELSDEEFDMLLLEYLEFDDINEVYDYLDTLSDDELDELDEEFFNWLDENMGGDEGYDEGIDDDSEGLFASAECYEEVHFNDYNVAEELAFEIAPQIREPMLIGVEQQFADCEIWFVGFSDAIENEPVVSDIPTLVLSGQYDPITPPEWGDAAAETLTNSYVYTFPAMGHGSIDVRECPTNIVLAFLDDPTSEPDASCIADMPPPAFITD